MRISDWSADAAEEEGVAELVLAGHHVLDVAERAPEREDAVGGAGVDHASHRVVPQVLLVRRALTLDVAVLRVLADQVAGDRKSVGQGKSVSVRVDLGGRRLLKKKKK